MNKKIKVMHIIHGFPIGGAEVLVKEYCIHLDRNKFEVIVLCFDRYNTALENSVLDAGVKVYFISDHYKLKFSKAKKVFAIIERLVITKKLIRRENPDIIHSHLTLNYLVKFSKPSKSTMLIHTVHNEPRIMWKKNIYRQIDFLSAKWLVKNYRQRFIGLHDSMKDEINRLFKVNNTIVLNNGIDFSKFKVSNQKKLLRHKLGIPKEAFVIGNIGRFEKQKNQLFLIEVFNEVRKKNKNAYLLLVGNGSLYGEIENRIIEFGLGKNVKILSNRSDIPEILETMDVFCFPSLYEGLGIVLIEAQKMNVKCVISDLVPSYVVVSNKIKQLSLNNTVKEWAECILNFEEEEISYINNMDDWNIKNVVKKLEQIYKNEV